ncbi:YpsA SLOG family protein [Desulfurivibrio sp. C05AmB]
MLTRIISGGQTGADQAGLDVAIKLGIPHGGWIPKGRMTEAGP